MPAPLAKLTDKKPSGTTYFFPSNLGSVGHYVLFTTYPTVAKDVQQINLTFGPGSHQKSGLSIKRTNPAAGDKVALYLPAVITNNQSAKYGDVEMGTLLSVLGKDGGAIDETVKKLALEKVQQVGGAEGRSLAAAEELASGRVFNNQIESIFESIDRRTFQFDFRMIPRSSQEAEQIFEIVKTFRKNMAPSVPNPSQTRQMIVPSLFEIDFYSDSQKNKYLPRIGKSICTSCNISYGGERISMYKDNHPIETSMQLTFQEIEIVTKEKIEGGF